MTNRQKKAVAFGRLPSYSQFMAAEEVRKLPVEQKVWIMEAFWEDFREHFERMDIPQEQKDLLDRRRTRMRDGTARLRDWASVKGTIGRR